MVCLAKETLCKPLNEREHKFYKTMGKTLIPFVPRYEGTMRVEVHEDDLGMYTSSHVFTNFTKKSSRKSFVLFFYEVLEFFYWDQNRQKMAI